MTLQECYSAMEADYDGVMCRLMTEERVKKYLLKAVDNHMLDSLCSYLEEKDYKEAFRAAHSLKGVCQNLGLTKLELSSSNVTEALRGGELNEDITPLLEQVREDYEVFEKNVVLLEQR